MNRASVFEWRKRFKEGRESVRDDERCESCKEVNRPELIGQRDRVRVTMLRFKGSFSNRLSGISTRTIHQSTTPSLSQTIAKMNIKTVPHCPYNPDLTPSDFCLFPKLRGCRYTTIEEMKEAVTKVIDTLPREDFHGAFQKFLERYNKCIAAGGYYFEED